MTGLKIGAIESRGVATVVDSVGLRQYDAADGAAEGGGYAEAGEESVGDESCATWGACWLGVTSSMRSRDGGASICLVSCEGPACGSIGIGAAVF